MSAAHTPGPWTVHSTMRDCVTFKGRNGIENLFLQNIDGYFACQGESDARLIAESPNLLKVLADLVANQDATWVAAGFTDEQIKAMPYLKPARAAIAKAGGAA